VVLPTPCPSGGLLAIGEAPGADEDELGEGFVGQAGQTLDALLVRHGLERNRDYGVANIVRCRPPGNRKPAKDEIERCLPWLAAFLLSVRPKVLLLVGATASEVFYGPGPLSWHIERSRRSPLLLAKDAHPILQPAIRRLHELVDGVLALAMPHTSGMAWNRKAPGGQRWREIGEEQVERAVACLECAHAA
jgi:DNA polymerase